MFQPQPLLPTTVVGSYPQPDWLIDRAMLSKGVPRVRMHEMGIDPVTKKRRVHPDWHAPARVRRGQAV